MWDLKERTRLFALRCIKLVGALPEADTAHILGKQLMRSSTSVGANYRAASLAQSKAAFTAKLSIVLEEADECCFWLDLIIEAELLSKDRIEDLYNEAIELTKIFASARKKAQGAHH
ncbi:MAG: four helix bundle protein [Candidatus Marinimicrobia bacterium]|nr:four helix bundle protein [Candidatus Neomarinimicrobiota bacterium]